MTRRCSFLHANLVFDVFALLPSPGHAVSRGVTLRALEESHTQNTNIMISTAHVNGIIVFVRALERAPMFQTFKQEVCFMLHEAVFCYGLWVFSRRLYGSVLTSDQ